MAPRAGLEPATDRLTADCSTTELPRNTFMLLIKKFKKTSKKLEARSGIEPLCKALQAPTSPLCHRANRIAQLSFNRFKSNIEKIYSNQTKI